DRVKHAFRRTRGCQAQHDQDQARPGHLGVHHHVSDHVRAAVRLRVRRGDRPGRRGCRLPGVPDRRDLRPDRGVRRHVHRLRPGSGHREGHHRPVPVTADVTVRGAGRPHLLRRAVQRGDPGGDGADRSARRLADPYLGRRGAARLPAASGLRLRLVLGDGLGRDAGAEPGGGQQRLLHGDLPAHLRREHVRAAGDAPRPTESLRGVEPGLCGHPGGARAVREHSRGRTGARDDLLGAAAPGALHLVVGSCRAGHLRPGGQRAVPPFDQPL
ncbi:MAG: Efflux ABC transporter, permease protein, partial [uncultured Nocardioidaceae bacterium]